MKNKFLLLLFLLLGNFCASANELAIGVGVHFGYGVTYGDLFSKWMDAAKLTHARDEILWRDVEAKPGEFSLRGGGDNANNFFTKQKSITPTLILAYGNKNYDGGGFPVSTTAINSFVSYSKWIEKLTKGYANTYELWNEWNLGAGSFPRERYGAPADYVKLASHVYPALKSRNPDAKILVGAVGQEYPEWKWIKKAIEFGLLNYADGISVHLYNHCDLPNVGSDKAIKQLDSLKLWIKNNYDKDIPIYVTEFGWPNDIGPCGVNEHDSAIHTLRFLLEVSKRDWVKGVWIYEFMDSGDDKLNREHNFGLHRRDGSEKFAGCIVRNFGKIVAGRPYFQTVDKGINASVYRYEGDTYFFYWVANPIVNKKYPLPEYSFLKGGVAVPLCDSNFDQERKDAKYWSVHGREPLVIKRTGEVEISNMKIGGGDALNIR